MFAVAETKLLSSDGMTLNRPLLYDNIHLKEFSLYSFHINCIGLKHQFIFGDSFSDYKIGFVVADC